MATQHVGWGRIVIKNVKKVGTLTVYPKTNSPFQMSYNPESGTYTPDWTKNNLTVDADVYFDGAKLTSGYSITYKKRDGANAETALGAGETVASNKLTVSTNTLRSSQTGIVTYLMTVTYREPKSQVVLSATAQMTYSLVNLPELTKYVSISGVNVFLYNSKQELQGSEYITLTAHSSGTSIKQWQYKNASGDWVAYPTTNNTSISGSTLKVYASESAVFIGDIAVIKVTTNTEDVVDIITITKIRDGASGGSSVVCTLSNDSHTIPCDSAGNALSLEGADTTVHVYEGGVDVTSQWTITTTLNPSNGSIVGSWNPSTHTYSVTKMTTDVGYVLFTCKKSGKSDITARFSLAKNRAGADSVIYMVEASSLAMNRNISNVLTPSSVVFSSYSKTGAQTKKPYSGRFIISEAVKANPADSDFTVKYTSTQDEATKSYTPSATATMIKAVLYASGGTTNEVDRQTVVITKDGATGATGAGGISVILGNEAELIPCTNVGNVASEQTITIPFDAYKGITRVAATAAIDTSKLPDGITQSSVTASTASASGLIKLAVASGKALGGAAVMRGEIDITFTCEGQTIKKKFVWTKSKAATNGTNAVLFQVYAPYGDVIVNSGNNVTLDTMLISGTTIVSSGVTYVWKKFDKGTYTAIADKTTSSLTVTPDMVDTLASFCCEATYYGKTYKGYWTVTDKSDPLQLFVDSSIGTELENNNKAGCIYTRAFLNGKELDALKSTTMSETPPSSPSAGDFYYKIDKAGRKVVLQKYSGTAWADATGGDLHTLTYQYYKLDEDGNAITMNGDPWATGKTIYFDNNDLNPTLELRVRVTD